MIAPSNPKRMSVSAAWDCTDCVAEVAQSGEYLMVAFELQEADASVTITLNQWQAFNLAALLSDGNSGVVYPEAGE